MYLIFDTETTGLPLSFSKPVSDFENWNTARCVQIAWQLHDKNGLLIDSANDIIKPSGFEIPLQVVEIHKISNDVAHKYGISISDALFKFSNALFYSSK